MFYSYRSLQIQNVIYKSWSLWGKKHFWLEEESNLSDIIAMQARNSGGAASLKIGMTLSVALKTICHISHITWTYSWKIIIPSNDFCFAASRNMTIACVYFFVNKLHLHLYLKMHLKQNTKPSSPSIHIYSCECVKSK